MAKSKANYVGKYVGFKIPDFAWEGMDWLYDIIENRGERKFYLIDATDIDEAKRKLFDEFYKNEWDTMVRLSYATERARHILEDDEESELIIKFEEHDAKIITEIFDKYDEANNKDDFHFIDEHINKLSEKTIYDLAFDCKEIDLGIVKIEKNL